MTSRRFTDEACPFDASMISAVSRSAMECSRRWREKFTIHRSASVVPRVGRTSMGTWYVAPPTRRDFTSSSGLTFSTAFFRVMTGSFAVRSLMISSAL